MKIAVSSEGADPKANVDPRFGRARTFLLYDTETEKFEELENVQAKNLAQGAGIQAAQRVADHRADVVLTGHCGPKAYRTLRAAGIDVVLGATGTVEEAVSRYVRGELRPATGPDVEGHW
jgi:predicted Fe-Mo cluster-binding NifX family protein